MLRLRTFGGLKVENSAGDANVSMRPRQLALLAIVAATGKNGIAREKAVGILWADSSPQSARHALSQTLYGLRRELGVEVILATRVLRLDSSKIESDVGEFREAVATHDWNSAAKLYAGPFLEGFYLGEAPDFEQWSEAERSDLALHGLRAIESVAVEHEKAGRLLEAAHSRRRLTRFDPLSEAYAAAYIEVLAAAGDRAGALAHGKTFAEHLRRELDTGPGENFQQLMKRVRIRPTASLEPSLHRDIPPHVTPAPAISAVANTTDEPKTQTKPNRSIMPLSIAGVATVALISGWLFVRDRSASASPSDQPVLAVGRVRDLVTPDSVRLGGVLAEMLTTSLGRVKTLRVISKSRMLELTPRDADTARTALAEAARRAGATELLEGELIPLEKGALRLDIRRVNLSNGRIRSGYGVTGTDRMALLDSVTALIAAELRLPPSAQTLAEVSTHSPLALRYYEDGLRAFYQFDAYAANRLFRAAVREDSTFAMALYYAWWSGVQIDDPSAFDLGLRALALAPKASERDRLLIITHVGGRNMDMRSIAAAESLATRYPNDPEAVLRAAAPSNDLARAIRLINRSIALDSAAGTSLSANCRLCSAFAELVQRYAWADSTDMVEKTVRRWMRLRPDDAAPWSALAEYYVTVGRMGDAAVAAKRYEAIGGLRGDHAEGKLVWTLRADDVDGALGQCPSLLIHADQDEFPKYRWLCTIALRMAGRFSDAMALLQKGKIPGSAVVRSGARDEYQIPIVDWESGKPLAAAPKFAGLGYYPYGSAKASPGMHARTGAWRMTLSASASIAGGDTLAAKSLVDSIQAVGSRSIYDRDPKLHHFIRGLLFARQGASEAAVREYRLAISSLTAGYTRINLELARTLIALNRPVEAIPIIRAPLHGGLDGPNLYLTRTETHEVLAKAFEAAGRGDSALVHFRIVANAWKHADPILRPRYEYARSRVAGNWR